MTSNEDPTSSPRASANLEDLIYYKSQYEQLEAELADFQSSSRELEAELEKDVEASEKRERELKEKVESLCYEVDEWKVSLTDFNFKEELSFLVPRRIAMSSADIVSGQTKYKQSKQEANTAQNTLQKEITTLRDTNRTLQLRLRDIEVANDDFERQARNTTSSLDDLESKYNVSIERGVIMEEEMKAGEQEREALRIETQRLRDELSDLKVEAEIRSDKLRHAETALERQRLRKPTLLNAGLVRSRSPVSPTTTASSPTIGTPPTKSASSTISEAPTPPSPPSSEPSIPVMSSTPAQQAIKSRLSLSKSVATPRPITHTSRPPRHSRDPSAPVANDKHASSVSRRTTLNRQESFQSKPGISNSGSLYQIRGLIGKMQKLEQRVNSARSKLPAPTSTPPHASPRSGSALGHSYIPPTVTMRTNKRRTGGSEASTNLKSPTDLRPSSRFSFGIPQPSPNRDSRSPSRPTSRTSFSSQTSISHLPSAPPSSASRPTSRQSLSRSQTPLGQYANSNLSESRRSRSSIGGSYPNTHQGGGHGHSTSVSRLSNYDRKQFDDAEEENSEILTPTPARRTTFGKGDIGSGIPTGSGIPALASNVKLKTGGAGLGRRTNVGLGIRSEGDMGPPDRKRMSGIGETF